MAASMSIFLSVAPPVGIGGVAVEVVGEPVTPSVDVAIAEEPAAELTAGGGNVTVSPGEDVAGVGAAGAGVVPMAVLIMLGTGVVEDVTEPGTVILETVV